MKTASVIAKTNERLAPCSLEAENVSYRRQTSHLLLNKPIVTACASRGFDRHGETHLAEGTLGRAERKNVCFCKWSASH